MEFNDESADELSTGDEYLLEKRCMSNHFPVAGACPLREFRGRALPTTPQPKTSARSCVSCFRNLEHSTICSRSLV